jgi:N-methylhydantoinase A/oxoprolinase/acetone carboxylase beta subunit
LDREEIRGIARGLAAAGISQVAVTSVFGTSYPEDELRVAEWLASENQNLQISLSHRIGRFGILERGKFDAAERDAAPARRANLERLQGCGDHGSLHQPERRHRDA